MDGAGKAEFAHPTGARPPAGPRHRGAVPTPDERDAPIRERDVLDALNSRNATFRKSSASPLYRLGLLVVSGGMLLLPVLYLGLVGAVGVGVYTYATEYTGMVAGPGVRIRLLLYLAPIVSGSVLVVFMLKPIFSRRSGSRSVRTLRQDEAPLLFAFVKKLCRLLGAPTLDRLDLDLEVNASARHHMMSSDGDRFVLTIGLPLVAGLRLNQFAGVLAHEFGHFSQGAGMRLNSFIWKLNHWFARLVYERDALDEALEEAAERDDVLSVFANLTKLLVWVSRGILWTFMQTGRVISCFLMRQMEHDADRYEIALAGSDTFAATAERLRLLEIAGRIALGELQEAWSEGKLGDDLPGLIASKADSLPQDLLQQIRDDMSRRAGLFDTHPSDEERLARAVSQQSEGIFHIDAPAAMLFADFGGICKQSTMEYYEAVIGAEVRDARLVSTAHMAGRREASDARDDAFERYFQDLVRPWRPLFLGVPSLEAPASVEAALAALRSSRAAFESGLLHIRGRYEQVGEAVERERNALYAESCLEAGLPIDASDFGLPTATLEGVRRARERARALRAEADEELRDFEDVLRSRLLVSLQILCHPQVQAKLAERAPDAQRLQRITATLHGLQQVANDIRDLECLTARLEFLLGAFEDRSQDPKYTGAVVDRLPAMCALLQAIRGALSRLPYPFDHALEGFTVAQYAVDVVPGEEDVGGVFEASRGCVGTLLYLHYRCLAELSIVAERLETAMGFAPLDAPSH
jgi:Zn-dependent protease with chaperone function